MISKEVCRFLASMVMAVESFLVHLLACFIFFFNALKSLKFLFFEVKD